MINPCTPPKNATITHASHKPYRKMSRPVCSRRSGASQYSRFGRLIRRTGNTRTNPQLSTTTAGRQTATIPVNIT